MFSVLPHQLPWQTWMYEGQTKKWHQLLVVGNLVAKSVYSELERLPRGFFVMFYLPKGIQEGTFAAFFSKRGHQWGDRHKSTNKTPSDALTST